MMEKVTVKQSVVEFDSKYVFHNLLGDFKETSRQKNEARRHLLEKEEDVLGIEIQKLEVGVLLGLLKNGNVRVVVKDLIRFADASQRNWLEKLIIQAGVIAELVKESEVSEIRIATPQERHYKRVDFFINGRPVICRQFGKFAYYSEIPENVVPRRAVHFKQRMPDSCVNAFKRCRSETAQEPLLLVAPYKQIFYNGNELHYVARIVND